MLWDDFILDRKVTDSRTILCFFIITYNKQKHNLEDAYDNYYMMIKYTLAFIIFLV